MKKLVLFITCLLTITTNGLWAANYDFSANNEEHYDFNAICSTGQTLYYKYNNDGSSVTVTYPAQYDYYSARTYKYPKPTGSLTIPASVTNDGITYSVTSIGEHAFQYCDKITSVSIPNSVTKIGNQAFSGCTGITTVNFNATNCTSMGSSSNPLFANCSNLKTLTIGNNVTNIPAYAFKSCSGLTTITIPNAVTKIGNDAFYGCFGVTTVNFNATNCTKMENIFGSYNKYITTLIIGDNVKTIPDYAFKGWEALTSVIIPNAVTSIGNGAFEGCTGLTTVNYNAKKCDKMGTYNSSVFKNCNKFNTLIIGNNVTAIPQHAFYGNSSITSLTFGNSVTNINDSAFYACSGLTEFTIPYSTTRIVNDAFHNTGWWNNQPDGIIYKDEWCLGYKGDQPTGALSIQDDIKKIAYNAFNKCTGISTLTIGNSVTHINEFAFKGCTSIETLYFNAKNCTKMNNAFGYYDKNITTLIIGDNVKTIPDEAFRGFKLSNVTIGNSVTSIGKWAFDNCDGLTSVTIPNSVTSIGEDAFYGCRGLTSVTIPNSVTSIGKSAFAFCSGLTSITIPNSVTSIGDQAFASCSKLTTVNYNAENCTIQGSSTSYLFLLSSFKTLNIGSNVKQIPDYTFYNCNKITSISIPNSVTSIGDYAFCGCSGITSISIPNSVTSIGDYAFYGCSGITSVTIPNAVTKLGDYIFAKCTGLTSITIDKNIKTISAYAFYGCTGLTTVNFNAENCTTMGTYNEYSTNNVLAFSTCNNLTTLNIGNNVKKIPDYAFYNCTGLTTINFNADSCIYIDGSSTFLNCENITNLNIGNNVKIIPDYAFDYCSSITDITFSNSVMSIGNYAFRFCRGITEITLPSSVTSIGEHAFYGCRGLTGTLTIPNSVISIGGSAFYGCSGLSSVTIPNSVISIGGSAFLGCSGLTSVSIPKAVTSIGTFAFRGCTSITTVNFNATNCTTMGSSSYPVFSGCTNIKTLNIGDNVTVIPASAFYGFSKLTSITIPNSVTTIGSNAFYNCSGLTSVTIPNSVKKLSGFSNCTGLTSITIPDSVTTIGSSAFAGCTGLTSVTIPNSVTSIGSSAFAGCTRLTTFTIPKSVKSIGAQVFQNCTGITELTIPNSVTSIGDNAFSGCSALTTIIFNADSCTYMGTYNYNTSQNLTVFPNCNSLTTISIGKNVKNIPTYAFFLCSKLSEIKCKAIIPPIIKSTSFSSFTATLYVPSKSIESYKASEWKKFTIKPLPDYTITVISADSVMGSVNGSGIYNDSTTATITAIPNNGYYFTQWNDGNMQNPRTFIVQEDLDFSAMFKPLIDHTITIIPSDESMGSVSGSGIYNDTTTAILTAIPKEGHIFVKWSDENTENPRKINVQEDVTFTAIFRPLINYTITAISVDENMGSVSGGGVYNDTTTVFLSATPAEHYHFVKWNDENTENPRTLMLSENTTLTAIFAIDSLSLTVTVNDDAMGNVTITNEANAYPYGTEVILTATPNRGYQFVSWNDQNTDNPRTIIVTKEKTYTACFIRIYSISAISNNSNYGTVNGGGEFTLGSTTTLTATPAEGYIFVQWNDGSTQNPRQITVTDDATYTATFEKIEETPDAITEATSSNAQIFGGEKRIIINNAANATVAIYDVMGRTVVKEQRINTNNEVFAIPQTGIYIVRMGKAAKKVFVK